MTDILSTIAAQNGIIENNDTQTTNTAAKQAQATDVEVDSKLDILLNAISQL